MSGGNQIELSTRSGNTETPDETWSPWSAAYKTPDGSPITSPKARYLQWRAVLTGKGDGPVLASVTAAYLQRNLRPQVRSITIHSPGIMYQKPSRPANRISPASTINPHRIDDSRLAALSGQQGTGGMLRRSGAAPTRRDCRRWSGRPTTRTTATCSTTCSYRREGETSWKVLRRALQGTDSRLGHHHRTNGTCFIKVVASDLPVERRRDCARWRARQSQRSRSTTRPLSS